MSDIIKFRVPLERLSFSIETKHNPDVYRQGYEGPKLVSGEIKFEDSEWAAIHNVMEIPNIELFKMITDEIGALRPHPNRIYSGEVLDSAMKRMVEVVIRTVTE